MLCMRPDCNAPSETGLRSAAHPWRHRLTTSTSNSPLLAQAIVNRHARVRPSSTQLVLPQNHIESCTYYCHQTQGHAQFGLRWHSMMRRKLLCTREKAVCIFPRSP